MENKVSAVDFIKKGWEIFKKNPGINIAIVVAIFIISIISGTIASFLSGTAKEIYNAFDSLVIQTLVSIFIFSYAILSVRSGGKDANTLVSKALSKIDLKMWMNFAIYMIIIFLLPAILLILFGLAMRGANVEAVMSGLMFFGPVFMILMLIYGIFVSIYLAWGYYIMIDENLSAIEAIKKSISLAKGNVLLIFLVMLIIAIINVLGVIPFMLGLLITVPVSMFASAALYEYLSGGIEPVLSEEGTSEEDKKDENDKDENKEDSDDADDESSDENTQGEQNENFDSNSSVANEEENSEDSKNS